MSANDYLAYSIQQMIKNQMNRNNTLPTTRQYQAIWNNAEPADANLSNITLQGGGTVRYAPKNSHVTGLSAGDVVVVQQSGATPYYISGKLVGDIRLAQYSGDTIPPSGVGSITSGTITTTSIVINWTTATDNIGVAGYNVTIDGVYIGLVSPTTYTATGLTSGVSHSFKVQAVDYAGNLGAASTANFSTTASSSHGTFTTTYSGLWSASYNINGSQARITSLSNTMAQGYSGGIHRMGAVAFDGTKMASDLVGATVTAVTFRMTVSSAPSNGIVILSTGSTASRTAPANNTITTLGDAPVYAAYPWTAGQTKTIPFNIAGVFTTVQSGSLNAFYIGDQTSTSSQYVISAYGYQGGVHAPLLSVTYNK